jgi:hypothetical protein
MKYLKPFRGPTALYQIEGPENYNDPVHENLVLAALYQQRELLGLQNANFTLWKDPAINEFIRGVFWNDDPAVLMFDKDKNDDANFSSGTEWSKEFGLGKYSSANDLTNITGRSHFWDLQFLHGMACISQEAPEVTRYRALMWAELMYKVSIGESVTQPGSISSPETVAATKIQDVKIPADPKQYDPEITTLFSAYFSSATVPKNDATLKRLLIEGDPYQHLKIGKRAIGSAMHLIQDSFARGHTRRWLRNPQNLTENSDDSMEFQEGTFGDFGAVITFHSYKGQDSDNHDAFDEDTTNPWYPWSGIDYTDPASFNPLVGARNAIDWCVQLLGYWHAGTPWANGPRALFEAIFMLDGNVTAADTTVNETIGVLSLDLKSTGGAPIGSADPRWFVTENNPQKSYVVAKDPNWVAGPLNTNWVSVNTLGQAGADTTWAYRIEFQMPANALVSSAAVVGRCAADDQCILVNVNDVTVSNPFGTAPPPNYTGLTPFVLKGVFRPGYNYIDFFVKNDGGPTGLLVIIDGATAKSAA